MPYPDCQAPESGQHGGGLRTPCSGVPSAGCFVFEGLERLRSIRRRGNLYVAQHVMKPAQVQQPVLCDPGWTLLLDPFGGSCNSTLGVMELCRPGSFHWTSGSLSPLQPGGLLRLQVSLLS